MMLNNVPDTNQSLAQIAKEFRTFDKNGSHNFAYEIITQLKEINKNLSEIKDFLKPKESSFEESGK